MDIQKEREAFEAIPEIKDKITSYKMDFVNGSYDSLFSHINAWMDGAWFLFQEKAKAQAVPEGFALVPTKNIKYFSHDGENYEVHDTLAEAKHEAECAIESFRERLADQLCNPPEDGNFQQVGYGIVLAESGYSVDHIVTQDDVDNGEYGYDVGTEIISLFLIEPQESP